MDSYIVAREPRFERGPIILVLNLLAADRVAPSEMQDLLFSNVSDLHSTLVAHSSP